MDETVTSSGQIVKRERNVLAVEIDLEHPIDRLAESGELVERSPEQSLLQDAIDIWDQNDQAGVKHLKQIETESGMWFRDVRRPANLRRVLVDWVTPQGLRDRLEIDRDAAQAALKAQPFEFGFPLRPYQRNAIEKIEATLDQDRRSMLVAMTTGTGKTKLAIALLYRLLTAKHFRHVCFVVDRNALGGQAADEFKTTRVVGVKQMRGYRCRRDRKARNDPPTPSPTRSASPRS